MTRITGDMDMPDEVSAQSLLKEMALTRRELEKQRNELNSFFNYLERDFRTKQVETLRQLARKKIDRDLNIKRKVLICLITVCLTSLFILPLTCYLEYETDDFLRHATVEHYAEAEKYKRQYINLQREYENRIDSFGDLNAQDIKCITKLSRKNILEVGRYSDTKQYFLSFKYPFESLNRKDGKNEFFEIVIGDKCD